MMTVKRRWPAMSICEMEASIGNSTPSARSARRSPGRHMVRLVTPVSAKRRMCSRCSARKRSGMNRSSGWPIASDAGIWNICSAAALKRTMRCSALTLMIASMAEPMMAARRASLCRNASSARLRSEMSRRITE